MDSNSNNNNGGFSENNNGQFVPEGGMFADVNINSDPFGDGGSSSNVSVDNSSGSFAEVDSSNPFENQVTSDPFAKPDNPVQNAEKSKSKGKQKKAKKSSGKVWLVILIVFVLIAGAVAASPLLFMKLGDSNIESGDYEAASTLYSACFNLYGSENRTNAAKSIVEVKNGNTSEGIKHALESGIEVHISYDLNGGKFINSSRQTDVVFKNPLDFSDFYNAMKENYDFNGWTLSNSSYSPDVDDAVVEYSLKANFTPHVYTISYTNLYSNEKSSNPGEYTVESYTITLDNPERVGYKFLNWSGTDIADTAVTVVIPQGSTGNRAYIANWEPNKYNAKFVADWEPEKIYVPVTYKYKETDPVATFPVSTGLEKVATYDDACDFPILQRKGYDHVGWTNGVKSFKNSGIWVETEDTTFTPEFKKIIYKLTYDFAGGNPVENENYPKQYDVDCDDTVIGGAQRHGYNFLGWSYEGHDAPVANMVIPAHSIGDYNFVAKWQGKPHVVNLNAAGGVVSAAKVNVVFGNAYTIPVPTRLGYKFLGWYEGNSRFAENGTWNVDKDVSVVAKWEAIPYKVTYNSNGGSNVSPATKTITFDTSYSVPNTSRTGYNFLGWFDKNGTKYTGGIWKTAENVTLTASWSAKNYTVALNSYGGQGASSMTVYYDQAYTLPTPTKTGYKFEGWYNGSSKFSQSGTWKTDGGISLTARWTAQSYTVSFNSDGGKSINSMTVTYDSSYDVTDSYRTPTRTGYTFNGWYDSNGNKYTRGTWNKPNNMTLIARWTANQYTVSLDANTGSVSPSRLTVKYDSKYELPEPYKRGYEFLGWYEYSTKFADSGTWKETSNISLTAKWKVAEYQITLKPEGGDVSKNRVKVTYGSSYSLPTPTRTGYIFDGWYKGTKEFSSSGIYDYDDDITLKATWRGKSYSVYFDANGGSVNRSSMTVKYGEKYELPEPSRKGHKFLGWYSGSSKFASESTWKTDGDVHLTAKWEVVTFTVTLDPAGGSVSTKSIRVTYGDSFYLPTPSKKGYEFNGWVKGSTRYNGDTNVRDENLDSNVTFKADWSPIRCTIYLNANGGSVSTTRVTVEYNERYSLPKPELEGFRFKGWYYGGSKFDTNGTWKQESDITVTAEWIPES